MHMNSLIFDCANLFTDSDNSADGDDSDDALMVISCKIA